MDKTNIAKALDVALELNKIKAKLAEMCTTAFTKMMMRLQWQHTEQ